MRYALRYLVSIASILFRECDVADANKGFDFVQAAVIKINEGTVPVYPRQTSTVRRSPGA